MDEKKEIIDLKEETKKESIWKNDHTPMSERATSSGLTFWPKGKGGE